MIRNIGRIWWNTFSKRNNGRITKNVVLQVDNLPTHFYSFNNFLLNEEIKATDDEFM